MLTTAGASRFRPVTSQSITGAGDQTADVRNLMASLGFDMSEDGLQGLLTLLGILRDASQANKANKANSASNGGNAGARALQQLASLGGQASGAGGQPSVGGDRSVGGAERSSSSPDRQFQENRERDTYARARGPSQTAPREDQPDPEGTVKARNLSEPGRARDASTQRGLESWNGAPVNQGMIDRIRSPAIRGEIERAAQAKGIDPQVAKAIVGIESSGNPNARTGSYKGLFQLSDSEFRKYGNGGNIYNPRANIDAGLNSLKAKAATFEKKYGRAPTPTELYLAHQQGEGGLAAHLRNPDGSAARNMASTGEGRRKGLGWARKAIWGNVPTDMRRHFPGGVDSMTSRQFAAVWASKLQGIPYSQALQTGNVFGAFGPARE